MQLLWTIEVHKARLEQNAFSLDFVVHLGNRFHHLLLLSLWKDSLRFDVLNDFRGVGGVVENLINWGDERSVVYHAVLGFEGVDKLSDFSVG